MACPVLEMVLGLVGGAPAQGWGRPRASLIRRRRARAASFATAHVLLRSTASASASMARPKFPQSQMSTFLEEPQRLACTNKLCLSDA